MPPPAGTNLTQRALLAVALLVGFYLFGLAIAGGLLAIPWALWEFGDRLYLKVSLFCLLGAGLILWGLIPRRDVFTPPGPSLDPADQPELFALLRDVAKRTQQAMPVNVYLVGNLNAFVSQRGGMLGIGSRRVMGLGLPLLQTLSVDEVRGVIAHEFGHYHGGDTMLGPWLYRTRAAIQRTIASLAVHSEVLMKPFEWYGHAFLRITHAISRRQEFVADAIGAQVAGASAMGSGLRTIHARAGAYDHYWFNEFVPAVRGGFRPPLAAGFAHFVSVPAVAEGVQHALEAALTSGQGADPYDTHPPLTERLAALEGQPERAATPDTRPGTALLRDVPGLEARLVAFLTDGESQVATSWEGLPTQLFLPGWHATRGEYVERLGGMTMASLGEFARAPERLANTLGITLPAGEEREQSLAELRGTLGSCIASAACVAGATVRTLPGEPVTLVMASGTFEPFRIGTSLLSPQGDAAQWRAFVDTLEIGGIPLDAPVPEAPRGV